jgi:hypothetical protein
LIRIKTCFYDFFTLAEDFSETSDKEGIKGKIALLTIQEYLRYKIEYCVVLLLL